MAAALGCLSAVKLAISRAASLGLALAFASSNGDRLRVTTGLLGTNAFGFAFSNNGFERSLELRVCGVTAMARIGGSVVGSKSPGMDRFFECEVGGASLAVLLLARRTAGDSIATVSSNAEADLICLSTACVRSCSKLLTVRCNVSHRICLKHKP